MLIYASKPVGSHIDLIQAVNVLLALMLLSDLEVFGLVVDADVGLALLAWFWRLRDGSDPSFDCFCRC